ncbi:uncharacterized protein [Littorina saxatilis]|uniref:LEM domain-containing protein n=1 Tax=Littorina saxatilis TaxID=31220 RepID=A0AAN9C1S4_9CAEN
MLTAKLIESVAAWNLTTAVECLKEGASPNTLSKDGATAMHIAAGVGTEAVRLMLAYGGNPNVRSFDGSTPLHVAAAWGDKETLRLLLHNGANPNLVDQDGQRAVDVARSEQHAACVDYLKYYTMLVAIGDKEESPMYTAEPVDTRQAEFPPAYNHPPSQNPPSSVSSDEEDPVNLSSEYSDALSRRLSQLLNDGSSACLDVTSPGCPYIADKIDQKSGAGDRTILNEDYCAGVLDSSDSENSESNLHSLDCQCHSNHCCIHKEPEDTQLYRSTHKFSDASYFDKPVSPRCDDLEVVYGQILEKRMKQKYFPDLDRHDCVSKEDGTSRRRSHSSECLSPYCRHSHVRSPSSLLQERSLGHERTRTASPCLRTSRHRCDSSPKSKGSGSNRSPCCAKARSHHGNSQRSPVGRGHHSPFGRGHQKASSPHCLQAEGCSHSPCRRELQSESLGCVHCDSIPRRSRTSIKSSRSSPSLLRSHQCHHRTPSPHNASTEFHQSRSDHQGRRDRSGESQKTASATHKHLRKQETYPPATNTSRSPASARSPVTIMSVLGGPRSPPPGVFNHYGVDPHLTDISPCSKRSAFTDVRGDTDTLVVASRSGQSVDSGYCETYSSRSPYAIYASRKGLHVEGQTYGRKEETGPRHNVKGSGLPASSFKTLPCTDKLSSEPKNQTQADKADSKLPIKREDCVTSPRVGVRLSCDVSEPNSPLNFERDDCTILSSNLGSKEANKFNKYNSDKDHLSPHECDNNVKVKSDSVKFSPKADSSVSSLESFRTCEEASEPEIGNGVPQESRQSLQSQSSWRRSGSKSQSPHSASGDTKRDLPRRSHDAGQNKSCKFVSDGKRVKAPKRESLGFSVSELDESRFSSNSHDGRGETHANKAVTTDLPKNQRQSALDTRSSQSLGKSWVPPVTPLPDDSDLYTSDGSFITRLEEKAKKKLSTAVSSDHVSKWLENLSVNGPKPRETKVEKNERTPKRVSDESCVSAASSVQEFIYRDKENGIMLIERHIPSDYSGSSGRPSMESAITVDTDETVSYDWSDFVINDEDMHSSGSSFDITAGQTMNSQDTLKSSHQDSCDEVCFTVNTDNCEDKKPSDEREDAKSNTKGKKSPEKTKPSRRSSGTGSTVSSDATVPYDVPEPVSIPPELASLSDEAIYQSLKDMGEDPGPVLPSTRQTYLQHLASLRSGKCHLTFSKSQPGYSSELNRLLSGSLEMEDLAKAEMEMVAQFQTPDGRTWREGTIKSCFNYLLLDPRVTKNLPLRAKKLGDTEAFKTFLTAVFYIGKGKRSRPYCHLYEAISQLKTPKVKVSQKVQKILDIWSSSVGVVSLHCFQNVIPVEAYTREACMVDAIGLGCLTNVKKGDYYGVASTWPMSRRRCMGAYLLNKAYHIFLSEGERQICLPDIQRGK